MSFFLRGLAAVALVGSCLLPSAQAQNNSPAAPLPLLDVTKITPPIPQREFRGVWVASVDNIDWPSQPGLSADQQKGELLLLLERARQLHLNAILLQVRPACDALYDSPIEPWSPYLTGKMGIGPQPAYDPLLFAVTEAHKRGLELHAWFNPFRARQSVRGAGTISEKHISKTHPDWVRAYGPNLLWLDPGEKGARDYSLSVVLDVVKRYDVDGVHIDDYFYPYKIKDVTGQDIDFPDDAPWTAYQTTGGGLSRADWRRSNIDDFVQRLYSGVKGLKPWVKVGISPFGIWRPGNPSQIQGFDSYEQLYGDSRRWLREGWADYFTPQLYWPIGQTPQSFPVLLSWWLDQNVQGRHLWPGLYTSRADGERARLPREEIEYQIKTTRGFAGATGDIHFSAKFLLNGDVVTPNTLVSHLARTVYATVALPPASPWLAPSGSAAPVAPALLEARKFASIYAGRPPAYVLHWKGEGTPPWQWLVQWRMVGRETWEQTLFAGTVSDMPLSPGIEVAAVSALDRVDRLGPPRLVAVPQPAVVTTARRKTTGRWRNGGGGSSTRPASAKAKSR